MEATYNGQNFYVSYGIIPLYKYLGLWPSFAYNIALKLIRQKQRGPTQHPQLHFITYSPKTASSYNIA